VHRRHDRHLVLRAAPGLAARALAAEAGVVHLEAPIEFAPILAPPHGLHELVFHQPGAAVAHPELAHQFERRDVVRGLGEQLHGQEPARKPQLARLEDGAADQAALVGAVTALPVVQAAALEAGAGAAPPPSGPTKPAGQRAACSAARHCASVPYRHKNSGIDSPG
jgi:hypothetical protein